MGKPGPPTIINGQPSDKTITISFTAPVFNGGYPITNYEHQLNNDKPVLLNTVNSPIVIKGLTNETTYKIKIRARNQDGPSDWSNEFVLIAGVLPATPKITKTIPSDGQIIVEFTQPTSNSEISHYEYQLNDTSPVAVNTQISPMSIPRLVNGTKYKLKIRAVNKVGKSDWSAEQESTPGELPTRPVITALQPGDGRIDVNFVSSVSNNRRTPVVDYEYSLNGGEYVPAGTTNDRFSITGLENGKEYTVKIRAVNVVGASVDSNSDTEKPSRRPDPPRITELISGNQSITVVFDAPGFVGPISNGGRRVIGYRYQVNDEDWVYLEKPNSPITITGLANGTKYTVNLRAVNEMGTSDDSNPMETTPATSPSEPIITKLISGDKQITVYFNAPDSNGGSRIIDYEYSVNGDEYVSANTTVSPFIVKKLANGSPLVNGTSYKISIRAKNEPVGNGVESIQEGLSTYAKSKTNTPTPNTVVGYSPGDYFYADVNYCSKTCGSGSNQYCKYDTAGQTITTTADTNNYEEHANITKDNACTANEFYGKKLKDIQSQLHVTSQKYKRSTEDYNRELLTTVNYIVGIGVLFGYIYINNLLLPA